MLRVKVAELINENETLAKTAAEQSEVIAAYEENSK
jgi:hypothetical protein